MPRISLLIAGLPMLCLLQGCYIYRTVTFHVRDAETNDPIAGASVSVSYSPWIYKPRDVEGFTDERGDVRLRLADFNDAGGGVDVTCDSYQPHWVGYQAELGSWPFKTATLHLYREPSPTVVLVLPDDFRGEFFVFEPEPHWISTSPPGRRYFEFQVDPARPTDLSEVPPRPLHAACIGSQISFNVARYRDGRVIHFPYERQTRRYASKDEVAIRWLKTDPPWAPRGVTSTYVCGTFDDWVEARRRRGMPTPQLRPASRPFPLPATLSSLSSP